MKNAPKSQRAGLFMILLVLAGMTPIFQSHSPGAVSTETGGCPAPYNGELTGRTSSSISVEWDASGTPDTYKVWYYRVQDNYTSAPVMTGNLYHTFSGLSAGTYNIHIVAVCGQQYSGGIIVVDVVL